MKNGGKKIKYDSQLKSSAYLSFRLCFYIACFMFLSFRLLTSLTSVAFANSAAGNGRKISQSGILTLIDPNNVNGLELLRAEMSAAYGQNDTKSKDQLEKIIEQIRSVEFEPQKQAPDLVIVPEKAPVIEPNDTVPEVPVQQETAKQEAKPKPPNEPITEETLQMLRNLAKEPEKLANPLELGEILYVSGNVKEAATFYSEALRRKDPNDAGAFWDRAWILFQIGNCLRTDDMPAAAKMYQQLLTEYPNSPWADVATARNNLIAWYLKDEPLKLVLQVKQAGSKQDNIR
ncbi:MAG: tetratricopeptide repeat protein [Sedimentisphaerales bacterium]|nr:tetratricopeptide repeat protein [Sedimentisphaerales bacterium]